MRRFASLLLLSIPVVLPHTGLAQPYLLADSLYQAGDYGAAAEAYAAIAHQHPDSGRAWYRLGNSLYQTGNYDAAADALEKAVGTFQPAAYAHYLLAQVHADAGRPADSAAELRRTVDAQGVPYTVLVATLAFDALAGDAAFDSLMASIDPCGPAEYRQFDFWVGEWDVRGPAGQVAGLSSITREYNGCVIVVRWSGPTGVPAGTSQNFYHKGDGRWHQNWIDAQATNPLWLVGGLDESGAMILTDADGQRIRATASPGRPTPTGPCASTGSSRRTAAPRGPRQREASGD
ncbi:hypothetical protein BH20GEM1_BH20GEM1_12060 [soil metagenome]